MRRYEAVDQSGLHARPAAAFVRAVAKLETDVVLKKGDKAANAKSILEVLSLGINYGDEVTIDGFGEEADLDQLEGELQGILARLD